MFTIDRENLLNLFICCDENINKDAIDELNTSGKLLENLEKRYPPLNKKECMDIIFHELVANKNIDEYNIKKYSTVLCGELLEPIMSSNFYFNYIISTLLKL